MFKVRPDGLACFDVQKAERDREKVGERSTLGEPPDESRFDPVIVESLQARRESDFGQIFLRRRHLPLRIPPRTGCCEALQIPKGANERRHLM